jgi:hypothetical protein
MIPSFNAWEQLLKNSFRSEQKKSLLHRILPDIAGQEHSLHTQGILSEDRKANNFLDLP